MTTIRYGFVSLLAALALGCGGSPQNTGTTPVGESQGNVPDDLDIGGSKAQGGPSERIANGGNHLASPDDANRDNASGATKEAPAAVTFRLKNTAKDDLVLSVDKGWQPVIYAYSGEPPKATPILMFPTFCTGACSASGEEKCPVCKAPEKVKDIKAAEKREIIAPGKSLDVPWDGRVYVYEKTRVDGKKCDCFKRAEVPAAEYTVGACGLRITTSAKKSTKYQCIKTKATFPSEGPQVVELVFPKP